MSVSDASQEFYHVNRKVGWSSFQLLKAGDEFDVGGKSNPYFSFFETQRYVVPVDLPNGKRIESPALRFLAGVAKGEVQHPEFARIAHEVAKHFVTYLREVLWEDIRRREFPHLPSRQRCFWLISSVEEVKYWIKRLGCSSDSQVLRVRVQGRLHRANELYLIGDSEPMTETIQKARQYWLGIVPNDGKEEIICEGRVSVIAVITTP